jgi:hypothetical protein
MINLHLRFRAEALFTAAMLAIMFALSLLFGLRVHVPTGGLVSFVGIHYLYPLLGVGIWGIFALLGQKRQLAQTFFIALPCYALVLLAHFNIKLWLPFINPAQYDPIYWAVDQHFHVLIDACMATRRLIAPVVPLDSNFYMTGFIALFYLSFCYHALWTPDRFRSLFLAALVFQGLGGLSYLLFPALGPFVYESGLNPTTGAAQQAMLGMHEQLIQGGAEWLAQHGAPMLTAGLAAMPSLHAGGSFLFYLFAFKHGRPLMPLYTLIVGFILIEAVATRWHYLVDLPVGIALAWFSIRVAERLVRNDEAGVTQTRPAQPAVHTA